MARLAITLVLVLAISACLIDSTYTKRRRRNKSTTEATSPATAAASAEATTDDTTESTTTEVTTTDDTTESTVSDSTTASNEATTTEEDETTEVTTATEATTTDAETTTTEPDGSSGDSITLGGVVYSEFCQANNYTRVAVPYSNCRNYLTGKDGILRGFAECSSKYIYMLKKYGWYERKMCFDVDECDCRACGSVECAEDDEDDRPSSFKYVIRDERERKIGHIKGRLSSTKTKGSLRAQSTRLSHRGVLIPSRLKLNAIRYQRPTTRRFNLRYRTVYRTNQRSNPRSRHSRFARGYRVPAYRVYRPSSRGWTNRG